MQRSTAPYRLVLLSKNYCKSKTLTNNYWRVDIDSRVMSLNVPLPVFLSYLQVSARFIHTWVALSIIGDFHFDGNIFFYQVASVKNFDRYGGTIFWTTCVNNYEKTFDTASFLLCILVQHGKAFRELHSIFHFLLSLDLISTSPPQAFSSMYMWF